LSTLHLKVWARDGVLRLERCEQPGCNVDGSGTADCGRPACPLCGRSGSNLTLGANRTECDCRFVWEPATAATRQHSSLTPAPG
jgi:hypothetical protein